MLEKLLPEMDQAYASHTSPLDHGQGVPAEKRMQLDEYRERFGDFLGFSFWWLTVAHEMGLAEELRFLSENQFRSEANIARRFGDPADAEKASNALAEYDLFKERWATAEAQLSPTPS